MVHYQCPVNAASQLQILIFLFIAVALCLYATPNYKLKKVFEDYYDIGLLYLSILSQLPFFIFLFEFAIKYLKRYFEKLLVWNYDSTHIVAIFFFEFIGFFSMVYSKFQYLPLVLLLLSVSFVILKQFLGYSETEINAVLKDYKSIGAFWAHHAYDSYYKIVLENIKERIINFEKEHNVKFLVRKLVLLIPSSCDVRGTIYDKDENIVLFGELQPIECDQGGNVNRKYKNPVYQILDDSYIALECPSSILTLWNSQDKLTKEKFQYHRNCFIKTLRKLVKGSPCSIVVYDDDSGNSVPLHKFLLDTLSKEDTVILMNGLSAQYY